MALPLKMNILRVMSLSMYQAHSSEQTKRKGMQIAITQQDRMRKKKDDSKKLNRSQQEDMKPKRGQMNLAYKIPYQHNTVQNNTKTLKASEDD